MERKREAAKLGRYYRNKASAYNWHVVSDPLPVGGFSEGATFSDAEMAFGLIYKTLTRGTRFKHNVYGEFTVIDGKKDRPYRLKGKDYIACIIPNSPRLKITKVGKIGAIK